MTSSPTTNCPDITTDVDNEVAVDIGVKAVGSTCSFFVVGVDDEVDSSCSSVLSVGDGSGTADCPGKRLI